MSPLIRPSHNLLWHSIRSNPSIRLSQNLMWHFVSSNPSVHAAIDLSIIIAFYIYFHGFEDLPQHNVNRILRCTPPPRPLLVSCQVEVSALAHPQAWDSA